MFEVIFKLKDFFSQYKKIYLLSLGSMMASNLFSVFIPYQIGQLIDLIVRNELTRFSLTKITSAFIFSLLAAYIFEFIWSYYLFTGAAQLQQSMRDNLMAHFLRMRAVFFERFRVGDLMARSTEDVRAIAETAGYGIMVLLNATLFLTTIIGMMGLFVSWRLTFFSLLPLTLLAYAFGKLGHEVEKRFSMAQEMFASLNNDVLEAVDGIRVIRAYVKEAEYVARFRHQTESMLKKNNQVAEINAMFMPLVKIITSICTMVSFGYGTFLIYEGKLTIGDMVAFQMYLSMIVWPIISIGELTNVLRQGSAAMNRVEDILQTTDDMADQGQKTIEKPEDISIRDLNFRYSTSQEVNLTQIDLDIPKGKMLGIVGKTGSGKTTLLRQFLKQYPLGDGEFRYGEEQLSNIQAQEISSLIGYVPQDHMLFSRSIRENIAFGKSEASDQEILDSIRLAVFDEDLMRMDDGLDTMLGEKGVSVSGGQKQRIALARALIKDPEILILDDALSAVDAKTEQKIMANIQKVRANKTTLIATHRLSAVKGADEIIVLENGRIIERGTHGELLAQEGWYWEQYLRQELKEGGAA